MKNIKLIVGYEGTDFCGWQRNGKDPSIEEELKKALEQILQEKFTLQAASRTDAGVHAEGQVVNFFTSKENLDLKRLTKSLNSLLPQTIAIFSAEEMHADFHPTLDVLKKTYIYNLCYGVVQLPFLRRYSWHVPNLSYKEEIGSAKEYFLGKQDFSSLCNHLENKSYISKEREIFSIRLIELPDNRMQFEITGDHFLYKMVRNIVGTLVYVGMGKIQKEEIPRILGSKSRPQAGITAPAQGLSLKEVFYD